jgi:hypothetical protein
VASPDTQSITRLIRAAQQGRDSAVAPLLAVYFDRQVQLARSRLQAMPGMTNYDEDLALRSFYSMSRTVERKLRRIRLLWKHELKGLES